MSYQAIFEYLLAIVNRYKAATKAEKKKILDHATLATGLSRKHLIRRLSGPKEELLKQKRTGAPRRYPVELLLPHIKYLWVQMERISARRMKPALSDWLPYYDATKCPPHVQALLLKMSYSTLDRFLGIIRKKSQFQKGLGTTYPARTMKNKIPLNTLNQKIERPGFVQADTVAHCGNSAAGSFINSITLTDIDSTWTENRALYTKTGIQVRRMFTDIKQSLPFELLAVNTDSGSEFLNTPVVNFMTSFKQKPILFTRSRPYRKNDNCYVEQKNYTHVRELFGYQRLDRKEFEKQMNEIYKQYWNPLLNFFIPNFKLKEKIRIGARIVKKYDLPKTPYSRLIQSPHLTDEQKDKLRKSKEAFNPFTLKKELEAKLGVFFEKLRKTKMREAA